jgi:CheY-like chemotaxis protein
VSNALRGPQPMQGDQTPLVLIIEDEDAIADALALVIEEAGYAVASASSGPKALEAVQAGGRPQLIVSDFIMPQMDGAALIRAIRDVLGTDTPPIVLMSAAGPRYIRSAEADAYLPKPFTLEAVESLLLRFLPQI